MRTCVAFLFVLWLGSALASEPAAPPAFTKKPKATRTPDKVTVEFAVNRETDVAVYVENAKSEIIRHLVAGVLGTNPPAPLKAGSLEQAVVWDGKDDDENPATGGPFKVRVGLGLSAHYAGMPLSENPGPSQVTSVMGLATGPDGRVFVMDARPSGFRASGYSTMVFLRDGSYEKTIQPFPSHLPPSRLTGTGAFTNDRGYLNPIVFRAPSQPFYPFENLPTRQMAVTPDGHLIMAVVPTLTDTAYPGHTAFLAAIDKDGGTVLPGYAGPALGENLTYVNWNIDPIEDTPRLVASSDGKGVFMANLFKPKHVIYRVPLPALGPASVFFGEAEKPGNDEKHLNQPMAMAADGKGQLLVADKGNNRIVVLKEADGSFVESFPFPAPEWVGVHPKTGAVYVYSGDSIVKFSGWKNAREVARSSPPCFAPVYVGYGNVRPNCSFALDTSAEPPVLWIGRNRGTPALMRCEDRGTAFSDPVPANCYSATLARVTVDPLRRMVFFPAGSGGKMIDEATGKIRDVTVTPGPASNNQGTSYRLDRDGNFYACASEGNIWKCDANGKFLPFQATANDPTIKGHLRPYGRGGEAYLSAGSHGNTAWERDFYVDRKGDIYVMVYGRKYHGEMHVEIYGQDGTPKRTVIYGVTDACFGPKVDPKGNLYILDEIKPVGQPFPEAFKAAFATLELGDAGQQWIRKWNDWIYGSIVKFPPVGGNLWYPSEGVKGTPYGDPVKFSDAVAKVKVDRAQNPAGMELQGASWYRPGFSPLANAMASGLNWCHCGIACEFDVDDFGRTFGPDNGRQRVTVLDTNGNTILHIGAYGNQDYCGADSYVTDPQGKFLRQRKPSDPKELVSPFANPEIGLAWTVSIGVTDQHAYLCDSLNRRVLRVKLDYAVSETVAAP
jgi:hypothetical protein